LLAEFLEVRLWISRRPSALQASRISGTFWPFKGAVSEPLHPGRCSLPKVRLKVVRTKRPLGGWQKSGWVETLARVVEERIRPVQGPVLAGFGVLGTEEGSHFGKKEYGPVSSPGSSPKREPVWDGVLDFAPLETALWRRCQKALLAAKPVETPSEKGPSKRRKFR